MRPGGCADIRCSRGCGPRGSRCGVDVIHHHQRVCCTGLQHAALSKAHSVAVTSGAVTTCPPALHCAMRPLLHGPLKTMLASV
jgi:hypothetical protein